MNIEEKALQLLQGEKVRMSNDDYEKLTHYVNNGSDYLYNAFSGLASIDVTIGTIPVVEAFIKPINKEEIEEYTV